MESQNLKCEKKQRITRAKDNRLLKITLATATLASSFSGRISTTIAPPSFYCQNCHSCCMYIMVDSTSFILYARVYGIGYIKSSLEKTRPLYVVYFIIHCSKCNLVELNENVH